MPCFRHTSAADSPAACSFSTLIICSSVNLLLRMSVSRRNGLYSKSGTSTGSRSDPVHVAEVIRRLQPTYLPVPALGEQLYTVLIEFSSRTLWCACAAASQACGLPYSATTV